MQPGKHLNGDVNVHVGMTRRLKVVANSRRTSCSSNHSAMPASILVSLPVELHLGIADFLDVKSLGRLLLVSFWLDRGTSFDCAESLVAGPRRPARLCISSLR